MGRANFFLIFNTCFKVYEDNAASCEITVYLAVRCDSLLLLLLRSDLTLLFQQDGVKENTKCEMEKEGDESATKHDKHKTFFTTFFF